MQAQDAQVLLEKRAIPDDLLEFFEPADCGACYLCHLVGIFRELRRVLRKDGTVWCNLGDNYAANRTYQVTDAKHTDVGNTTGSEVPSGLKPKDLLMMPARVALALQQDGWWLRSDIIWSKPNPMPESVTDRCTTAHEHLFLLAKSATYFMDMEAIREPAEYGRRETKGAWRGGAYVNQKGAQDNSVGSGLSNSVTGGDSSAGRNRRTVWEIATEPFPGAHFAVFPQALVKPCVLAGTSERGVCAECGAPWERVVERHPAEVKAPASEYGYGAGRNDGGRSGLVGASSTTTGWRPTCGHEAATVPATVCDIFAGSGTVGVVAQKLGRRAVLIDASEDYIKLSVRRLEGIPLPMF
jgi:DNA modification methylase